MALLSKKVGRCKPPVRTRKIAALEQLESRVLLSNWSGFPDGLASDLDPREAAWSSTEEPNLSGGLSGASAAASPLQSVVAPEMPTLWAGTGFQLPTGGQTWTVNAGDDLQAVFNSAQPGDVILLEAGATFTGEFVLPNKGVDSEWIYIMSSAYQELPEPGTRVVPEDAGNMARLTNATSRAALRFAKGANHYRVVGLEVTTSADFAYYLVDVDYYAEGDYPEYIIIDRSYVHGTPTAEIRNGFGAFGEHIAVLDSHFSDIHQASTESHAIISWDGAGPYTIINNYLEAAGVNVMFGGEDPTIDGLVPSDIDIRGNHITKPTSWYSESPDFGGRTWAVKNLFELKNAQRVWISGNILENNWAHHQNGTAILFTPRNQGGTAPWSAVRDVTFENNIVRNTPRVFNLLTSDNPHPSQPLERVVIRNNLFYDVSEDWNYSGRIFNILALPGEPAQDVSIEHNTAIHDGVGNSILFVEATETAVNGFIFRDNLATHADYGMAGTSLRHGTATFDALFENSIFDTNGIIDRAVDRQGDADKSGYYPAAFLWADTLDQAGFLDYQQRNFQLLESSPFKNAATDGTDLGANINAVLAATGLLQRASLRQERNTVIVTGTDADDHFEFEAGSNYRLLVNGEEYLFAPATVSSIVFDGGGGENTAVLTGSSGKDIARLYHDSGVLRGPGYVVSLTNTVSITANSGGGINDVVRLFDTEGDENFLASPTTATMVGAAFSNTANGFYSTYGYAKGGGTDNATFLDYSADDVFVIRKKHAIMSGDNYYNRASAFDYYHTQAAVGDSAADYGSRASELLTASTVVADTDLRTIGSMTASDLRYQATGFQWPHGYARQGADPRRTRP